MRINFAVLAACAAMMSGCVSGQVLDISGMGASADGITDNASVINAAIRQCSETGGGTVLVPAGRYATGTVRLAPGVTLELAEGAELVAVRDLSAYGHLVLGRDLSRYDTGVGTVNSNCASDTVWTQALVIAEAADGAGIIGPGTIDGGDLRNPDGEEGMRGPHAVLVDGTKGFTLSGIKIANASNYAVLCYDVKDCEFRDVKISGGWDGIHVRGGENVRIEGCSFETGDDCVAGGYWKNMSISDCTFNSSCNGLRMIMPSDGLNISGCSFTGPGRFPHITRGAACDMLHAIFLEPGGWGDAPGDISGVEISGCRAENVLSPFCLTLPDGNHCTDIAVDGYEAEGCRMALSAKSWGVASTDSLRISNSSFSFMGEPEPGMEQRILSLPFDRWPTFPSFGAYFRNVGTVTLDHVSFTFTGRDFRSPVLTDNVAELIRL